MTNVTLHCGDSLDVMRGMPSDSVHSIVTDPPAGISFMSAKWDGDKGGRRQWIAWMTEIAAECLRLIRPGGHALVWALPRTSHWTATAWEDAGFELRDCIYHIAGSGFPKGHDISKAIDKHLGKEREVIGYKPIAYPDSDCWGVPNSGTMDVAYTDNNAYGKDHRTQRERTAVTAPATPEAAQWAGWNTALKPAVECWWLLRKPLSEPTVAQNVLVHGVGGLNIDACRIETAQTDDYGRSTTKSDGRVSLNRHDGWKSHLSGDAPYTPSAQGRWPANLLLDDQAAQLLDEMSGERMHGAGHARTGKFGGDYNASSYDMSGPREMGRYGDTGGASRFFLRVAHDEDDVPLRFFYVPKASKRDRDEGLEGMEERTRNSYSGAETRVGKVRSDGRMQNAANTTSRNHHPTVKPTKLMQWLVRLVTPPNGTVLDPFMGSGSTGKAAKLEGFHFVGIEIDAEYLAIAEKRIAAAQPDVKAQLPLLELAGAEEVL